MTSRTLAALALVGAALAAGVAMPVRAGDVAASDAGEGTARCVAVLKLRSNDLAQQVKAGQEAQRAELLTVLRRGGAFIGDAWLAGARDEDAAKARLAQAEEAVRRLPPAQAAALRQQCSERADALLQQAAVWQRFVIDRFAQTRLERLLR